MMQPIQPMPQMAPVDPTAVVGRRILAYLIDGLIASIIVGVVWFTTVDVDHRCLELF